MDVEHDLDEIPEVSIAKLVDIDAVARIENENYFNDELPEIVKDDSIILFG